MEKGCVEKSGVAVADVADKACEDFPVRRGRKPGGEGVEVFLCLTQIGIGDAARLVVKSALFMLKIPPLDFHSKFNFAVF